jgi:hypothetical protein
MQIIGTAASHTVAFGLSFAREQLHVRTVFRLTWLAGLRGWSAVSGREAGTVRAYSAGQASNSDIASDWRAVKSRRPLVVSAGQTPGLGRASPQSRLQKEGFFQMHNITASGSCIQTFGGFFPHGLDLAFFSSSYQDRVCWASYPGLLWTLMPQTRLCTR